MKKLIVVLAILSLSGIAFAAGIPLAVDPLNGPEVWTQEVYNGGTAALTSGTVVVWDFANATAANGHPAAYTSRCMRVLGTSTTADDIRVAGVVVDPSIPASGYGTIAIYGPVYTLCAMATDVITVLHGVSVCAVAGQGGDATGAADTGNLGYLISTTGNTIANGGYGTMSGVANFQMLPVMVNPNAQ